MKKKPILLLTALLIFACSSSDDDNQFLRSKQYGMYIKPKNGGSLTFSFRFYDYLGGSGNGEVYKSGDKTITEPTFILAPTPSNLEKDYALIEVVLDENNIENFEGYWISNRNDYYLTSNNLNDLNTEANSIFEVNKIKYINNPDGNDFYEASVWLDDRLLPYDWVDKNKWQPY